MIIAITKLLKIWRKTKVIALLKPDKTAKDPRSLYRSFANCTTYELLERVTIPAPIIDSVILQNRTGGFHPNRSCADQVLAFTCILKLASSKERLGNLSYPLTALGTNSHCPSLLDTGSRRSVWTVIKANYTVNKFNI